ncbi:uncharacterized protein LOC111897974 [Lactuca sativa]|uniref:uncharacterized protein LOC111897974 n=1 Tax=Lactuca sativa TaxID=4236 RepID=UPI000CD96D51|nr:uncharacterized protein LOC111897974 [Lactuca sativa]
MIEETAEGEDPVIIISSTLIRRMVVDSFVYLMNKKESDWLLKNPSCPLPHDGTTPPAKTDEDYECWSEIDAIVLQWIYRTLSDDLLTRVLEPDSTAYEAWTRIHNIFLNNKGSRAAALEHEFNNLTLRAMPSLEDYCQRLKELADQLNDVDCPVNERRLVLQLVRGLSTEYDLVGAYVNQTLPPWETACSMLQLEHQRQHARDSLSPADVAAAVTYEPSNPPPNYPIRCDTSAPNR